MTDALGLLAEVMEETQRARRASNSTGACTKTGLPRSSCRVRIVEAAAGADCRRRLGPRRRSGAREG